MDKDNKDLSAEVEAQLARATKETLAGVERMVKQVEQGFESTVRPVRKGVFERFPVLFLLAVTLGVGAVSTGIEQVLISHELLRAHPWLIFWFGVAVLAVTGTMYKKLG